MKPRELLFACLAAAMVGCNQGSPEPEDPLRGAWSLIAMHLVSADGDSVQVPVHESLFIFADGYFSIAYAFGDRGSVPYAERWHPSDTEKAARFSSLIVNAGSYRLSVTQLEVLPMFALAPEFVGGKGVFSYSFSGDTLELTWQRSIASDGLEYPSAGTVTLLRLLRAHPAARLDHEAETRGS